MTVLLVFVGGAVGAPTRYLLDRLARERLSGAFPWGTLIVNLLGSVVLGALLAAGTRGEVSHTLTVLVGTGFCGALTTFSTLGYETVRLLEDGSVSKAALNAAASLALGVIAALASYTAALALL